MHSGGKEAVALTETEAEAVAALVSLAAAVVALAAGLTGESERASRLKSASPLIAVVPADDRVMVGPAAVTMPRRGLLLFAADAAAAEGAVLLLVVVVLVVVFACVSLSAVVVGVLMNVHCASL